jgi:hypothetical protein
MYLGKSDGRFEAHGVDLCLMDVRGGARPPVSDQRFLETHCSIKQQKFLPFRVSVTRGRCGTL